MFRSRRQFLKYAIALPSLSFAAASCVSKQQSSKQSITETKPVATSLQADDQLIKIRIAYPSGMNGQIAKTMEKAEIAKRHNLDATFKFFQYGPPMMEALASNDIDTAIVGLTASINYLSRNPQKASIIAYLGNSTYSLMVPKTSNIKSEKDLRGKRVAVSFGSDSHLDLLKLLDDLKLNPKSDVELLNTPPNELQLAFEREFADAAIIRQPQSLKMQEKNGAQIIKTWPSRFVALTRSDYLDQNPQVKGRYIQSLRESILYISTHKSQASEWFAEQIRTDPEVIRRVSDEDPNYKATKLEDISVELTDPIKMLLEEWGNLSYQYGFIKNKVDWNWQ